MAVIRRSVLPLLAATLSACASSGASGSASAPSGSPRWTGNLKQPAMASSAVISGSASRAQAAAYGSVVLTPAATPNRTHVDLTVTAPEIRGSQIAWAVYEGQCGGTSAPVIAVTEFPLVDVSNSGTGVVRSEMAFALTPGSTYHVNVYGGSRATDTSNVLMCTNLTYSGPRT